MADQLDLSLDELISKNSSGKAPTRGQQGRARRRQRGNPYPRSRGGRGRGRGGGRGGETNCTVYVGNLDWSVKWQELKDHMKEAGEIEYADVMTYGDGKSVGAGLVRYSSPREAKKAIAELTGTELNGREIFVREDRVGNGIGKPSGRGGGGGGGGGGRGGTTVFVGNLSWGVSWQDLKDHMKTAGDVQHADIIVRSDGKSSGGGLVTYTSAAAAKRAINELTDTELDGRQIFVREDREAGGGGGGYSNQNGGSRERYGGSGNDYGDVSVYVGNIPWSSSWQNIKDLFADYNVLHCDVGEPRNGRMRGWAILKFGTKKDAGTAIREMNGYEYEGREIEVRYDEK